MRKLYPPKKCLDRFKVPGFNAITGIGDSGRFMFDVKWIRDHAEEFDLRRSKRGLAPLSAEILALDDKRRGEITLLQDLQNKRNALSQDIGKIKKQGGDAAALMAEVAALKDKMAEMEATTDQTQALLKEMVSGEPNLPADEVPAGKDEKDNKLHRMVGAPKNFSFSPMQHFDLGERLGMMSFEDAAKLSGTRFVVLKGALARLERALGQFMLDIHTTHFGYTEMAPPYLVKENALFGTGQLPKFRDDNFKTTTDLWLIPTSEVSLTNLAAESIIDETQLPLRYTALTPCFRSEAGAAGKDTRGMIRQHQFHKVELVSIAHPDHSDAEHERMTSCAEDILKRLDLPYRVMMLCAGDMGFSARKTYDIEVWLPGAGLYREISSCSNCGDFQARRMNARFRRAGEKGTHFVHTLNGSGLAVGRCLIAVMENYQMEDGSIRVPDPLKPYMGGIEVIRAT